MLRIKKTVTSTILLPELGPSTEAQVQVREQVLKVRVRVRVQVFEVQVRVQGVQVPKIGTRVVLVIKSTSTKYPRSDY